MTKDFKITRTHKITIDFGMFGESYCNKDCNGLEYNSTMLNYECIYNHYAKIETEWINGYINYIRCLECKNEVR